MEISNSNTALSIILILLLPLSVAAFVISKPFGQRSLTAHNAVGDFSCAEDTKASLSGKHVILTGASSGLGKAIAYQLAQCNVQKLVLSGRNEEQLKIVKAKCEDMMGTGTGTATNIQIATCDLSDESSVENFSNEAMSICDEKADMLILCGGISSRSPFLETNADVDKMLMQVNFLSGSAIAKRVIPSMVESKQGNIIWISSVQGLLGTPYRTSYAASKFAVQGYCEALRSELTSSGIQVSCVSPGYIKTNLSKGAIKGDGSKHGIMDETTSKGADPNEIAVEILDSVKGGKTDFVVAATFSAKAALVLKFFAPSLLENLLVKRFKKAST
jgi:dehydrogenase/reductase SDR family protein 7B